MKTRSDGTMLIAIYHLGTVIGGLIIWHLLREETKAEFAA